VGHSIAYPSGKCGSYALFQLTRVDAKLQDQAAFVQGWQEHVTVRHGAGRGHKKSTDPRAFSASKPSAKPRTSTNRFRSGGGGRVREDDMERRIRRVRTLRDRVQPLQDRAAAATARNKPLPCLEGEQPKIVFGLLRHVAPPPPAFWEPMTEELRLWEGGDESKA
jgi:hypothetical protein